MATKASGIRLPEETIEKIKQRAARRKMSFNEWLNWAVERGLRDHKRRS